MARPEEEGPWEDWNPSEQTAEDVLRAAAEAQQQQRAELAKAAGADTSDDDGDDWQPTTQGAAAAGCEDEGNSSDEDDSDDDWAPQTQGAVDADASEKAAIAELLKPTPKPTPPERYLTKQDADAAGKMLQEMMRPPTIQEAKAEIPRGPDVDVDEIPAPKYREMTQQEAINMVNRGATVNYHGEHGRTPLHKAAEFAYPMLVQAICDAGGDVDIRDNFGETPLLLMAHSGSWHESVPASRRCETMQKLLALGADVHAVNPRGRGVLHLACTENDQLAVETFIEGMADVNARDMAGFSPLMWASGRNGLESVKMLLDYEADLTAKANRGQTAMTFALTNGNSAVADILERHKMLLDREQEAEPGSAQKEQEPAEAGAAPLQLPKLDWACKKDPPSVVEPYNGKRVYPQARPDRKSNVYA